MSRETYNTRLLDRAGAKIVDKTRICLVVQSGETGTEYLGRLERRSKEYLFVTRNIGSSPSSEEDKIYM